MSFTATDLRPLDSLIAGAGKSALFRMSMSHGGKRELILLDQIKTTEKTRLAKRLGTVSKKTLTVTLGTLQEVFAE